MIQQNPRPPSPQPAAYPRRAASPQSSASPVERNHARNRTCGTSLAMATFSNDMDGI